MYTETMLLNFDKFWILIFVLFYDGMSFISKIYAYTTCHILIYIYMRWDQNLHFQSYIMCLLSLICICNKKNKEKSKVYKTPCILI